MRTRKEILESRIARLEKLLKSNKSIKNESKILDQNGRDFLVGAIVEDLNGYSAVVIDMGSFRDMYNKWYNRLMPASKEEIDDYLVEFDGETWVDSAFTIVTKFEYGGGIAMSTDPESELEVIGGIGDDYEFESNNRRCESKKMPVRTSVKNEDRIPADRRSPIDLLKFVNKHFNLADQISNFLRFDMPAWDDPESEDDNYKRLASALADLRRASYSVVKAAERIAGKN